MTDTPNGFISLFLSICLLYMYQQIYFMHQSMMWIQKQNPRQVFILYWYCWSLKKSLLYRLIVCITHYLLLLDVDPLFLKIPVIRSFILPLSSDTLMSDPDPPCTETLIYYIVKFFSYKIRFWYLNILHGNPKIKNVAKKANGNQQFLDKLAITLIILSLLLYCSMEHSIFIRCICSHVECLLKLLHSCVCILKN